MLFTSGRMTSSRFRLSSPKQYSKIFFDLPGFCRTPVPAYKITLAQWHQHMLSWCMMPLTDSLFASWIKAYLLYCWNYCWKSCLHLRRQVEHSHLQLLTGTDWMAQSMWSGTGNRRCTPNYAMSLARSESPRVHCWEWRSLHVHVESFCFKTG